MARGRHQGRWSALFTALFSLALLASALVPSGYMPAAGTIGLVACADMSPDISGVTATTPDHAMPGMVMPDGKSSDGNHDGSKRHPDKCAACRAASTGIASIAAPLRGEALRPPELPGDSVRTTGYSLARLRLWPQLRAPPAA